MAFCHTLGRAPMNRRPHAKAAAIVSSFVAATLFAASLVFGRARGLLAGGA